MLFKISCFTLKKQSPSQPHTITAQSGGTTEHQTRGVGTIRSIQGLPQSFPEDDGGISSSGEEDDDEGSEDEDEEAEHEAAEGGAGKADSVDAQSTATVTLDLVSASRSETASVVAPISATAISGRSDTKLPISLTSG